MALRSSEEAASFPYGGFITTTSWSSRSIPWAARLRASPWMISWSRPASVRPRCGNRSASTSTQVTCRFTPSGSSLATAAVRAPAPAPRSSILNAPAPGRRRPQTTRSARDAGVKNCPYWTFMCSRSITRDPSATSSIDMAQPWPRPPTQHRSTLKAQAPLPGREANGQPGRCETVVVNRPGARMR